MAEVKYEVKEVIISVNDGVSPWNLELSLVSWNGREPKYDIRKWNPDHSKMGKGVTMSEDEAILLFQNAEKLLGKFRTEPKQEPFHIPSQDDKPPVPTDDDAPPVGERIPNSAYDLDDNFELPF